MRGVRGSFRLSRDLVVDAQEGDLVVEIRVRGLSVSADPARAADMVRRMAGTVQRWGAARLSDRDVILVDAPDDAE